MPLRTRTNVRILGALALLQNDINEFIFDDLEREAAFRRWLGDDVDELFTRIEALEARLPTEPDDGVGEPEFVEEAAAQLDESELNRSILAGAIELELPVTFIYTNGDGVRRERILSAYELRTTEDGRRFVLGWEHEAEGLRQFDTAGIENFVESTEAVAYRQPE